MPTELKDTLTLPETSFPMRGNLSTREPETFAQWDKEGLYEAILHSRSDGPAFILHDGPPYANGDIHMGHALNKILKDFVIRYKSMQGHKAPYVPGWDCHGLPIEQQILRQLGDNIHEMEPLELRRLCHDYATGWIEKQREQFKRLGIMGDWEAPYSTVDPVYEVGILKVLHALVQKGLIRKGHKAVHWDPVFRTALAEAEIEYHTHRSPSIYVAMRLLDPGRIEPIKDLDNVSIVIWTTTPWTMPANMGICLHPEFDYVALRLADGRHMIVAKDLADAFVEACGLEGACVVATFKAGPLDRALAAHPVFDDRESLVMLGDHVTLEQGTGCVHTAPGHGADDFQIGQAYGLPVFCPVDDRGCYTEEFPAMQGQFVFKANPAIVDLLRERGLLMGHREIEHEYPYSWRSKQPIIFRATEQWFMSLAEGGVRDKAIELIDTAVTWIPEWGRERIRGMVERRPEWCISRQRHWGVPIPSIRDLQSGRSVLLPEVIEAFIRKVSEMGTDAWYALPIETFLPAGLDPAQFEKEFDILDVWFDSGASHVAVLEQDPRLQSPADLYLEGSDQHRGWFQHALLTAVGARDHAPFKAVLTHGFVLDGHGKAMSKSMGNVISPLTLIEKFGADILRLWVASTDYRNDVAISPQIVQTTADTYRTIRNSLRFQLGNISDFDPIKDRVPVEALLPLDRWALHELAILVEQATQAYERYEFHRVYQLLNRFYTVTLSARYHDFLKDRLYTTHREGHARRSAQTVIHDQVQALARLLAPILVHTCDEAWANGLSRNGTRPDSIHLQDWPVIPETWKNDTLAHEMAQLMDLRDLANEKLEALRVQKVIGKSLEAAISIQCPDTHAARQPLEKHAPLLAELFIVSSVCVEFDATLDDIRLTALPASGETCPRCWRVVPELSGSALNQALCPRCADALHPSS